MEEKEPFLRVQKGLFRLKSQVVTDTYVDARELFSTPDKLNNVARALCKKITEAMRENPCGDDFCICGVPYGAVPLATLVSQHTKKPLIMLRKHAKEYGTMKLVEATPDVPRSVVLVEDVVTTGSSIREARKSLEKSGFFVVLMCAVVVREQQEEGDDGDEITYLQKLRYKDANYGIRAIMAHKHSNLILAWDDQRRLDELFTRFHELAPYIVGLKVHSELLNLGQQESVSLSRLCRDHFVILWEDRKFSDIANVVHQQLQPYRFTRDVVSICPVSGPDVLQMTPTELGAFVVCEMSSRGTILSGDVSRTILSYVRDAITTSGSIIGLVCQSQESILEARDMKLLAVTPGIRLRDSVGGGITTEEEDGIGQVWTNPEDVSAVRSDLYVVGRGITASPRNLVELTRSYCERLYRLVDST